MTCPAILDPKRTLVIVDLSWWLTKAFHIAGVDGMAKLVTGWLVRLLSEPLPWGVAVALDSVGPTWRHRRTASMDPDKRYKAGREPRPQEYYAVSNRVIDIVALHGIPLLFAEGWEADDVMASVVSRVRSTCSLWAAPLQIALLTADKDMAQLVAEDVVLWDGDGAPVGVAAVVGKWSVPPCALRDLLAIMGDASDNVPGAKGLGQQKASALLRHYGSLEKLLTLNPETELPDDEQIRRTERLIAKAKREGKIECVSEEIRALEALRQARSYASWVKILQDQREQVELSHELVTLDASAPVLFDLAECAVGGFDAEALREAYSELGFDGLARDVTTWPKERLGA